jgi:TldD protein
MTQRAHSKFLSSQRPKLHEIIAILAKSFDYISVLGTDDRGVSYFASPGETRTSEPLWVQRGFVFRAQKAGVIAEYACPLIDSVPALEFCNHVKLTLDSLFDQRNSIVYPPLPDTPLTTEYNGTVEEDPFSTDPELILSRLAKLRTSLANDATIPMAYSRYESVDVSRLFISPNRDLFQSFAWSQAYIFGVARKDQNSKLSYRSVAGRKGVELLRDLENTLEDLSAELKSLINAIKIEPGEYDVICDPDVAGTLAHEAFGHGVETDMFRKGRAKAVEYLGKKVGSNLVTMYDGAKGIDHTGSYLFDDEGTSASITKIIDKGILMGGISDSLSALSLGLPHTGNGRRQAYSHKAYARMTNTYFAPGSSSLDAMISSIQKGWLLSRLNAGMEDPRNWGIQLICMVGKEIVNGKLTGRVASPVICSGYVPDVLSSIDMVSKDFHLTGSGACGKGHKELVKVSSGGPYIKTKMRLG